MNPIKNWGELRCSGRVSVSCSTSGTHLSYYSSLLIEKSLDINDIKLFLRSTFLIQKRKYFDVMFCCVFQVVYITAHFRPQLCFNLNRKSTTQYLGLVGVAIALPPPTITELRIESDTFIMRLTPNLKVIYCDTM